MANTTPLKVDTHSDKNNPEKTESVITGGENQDNPANKPDLKVDTRSDPNNPVKTESTLTENRMVKLTVTGPFNGEVSVPAGHPIKEALIKLNDSNDRSYGNFKYRQNIEPIALTYVLNSDLIISSHPRG